MKNNKILFLGVGVIFIAVGVFLFIQQNKVSGVQPTRPPAATQASGAQPARTTERSVNIVVARQDIKKEESISQEMVKLKKVRAEEATDDDIDSLDIVVGKVATTEITTGERITRGKIAVRPGAQKLAMKIPEGKRAVTIDIGRIESLEGMIRPGDRVDMVGTFEIPYNTPDGKQFKQKTVIPMFEDIQVLAVGNAITAFQEGGKYNSITFALDPEQSSLLVYAAQIGKVQLLLRSPLDTSRVKTKQSVDMPTLWQKLLSISNPGGAMQPPEDQPKQPKKEEPKEPEKPKVEVFIGGSQDQQKKGR